MLSGTAKAVLADYETSWLAGRNRPLACARYEEEWVANIDAVPGKLSPLVSAFGHVLVVPRMGCIVDEFLHLVKQASMVRMLGADRLAAQHRGGLFCGGLCRRFG